MPQKAPTLRPLIATALSLLALGPFVAPRAFAQLTAAGAKVLDECDAPGDCLTGDSFGAAVATGDFNGDDFADLAIGVPGETVGGDQNAGSVHVFYGSAAGLTVTGEQIFDAATTGIPGAPEPGDLFGAALAAADFDSDGFADLAIGLDGEDLGTEVNDGTIVVLFGSSGGLVTTGALSFSQDNLPPGSGESSEPEDSFGSELAASPDGALAVGVPGESFFLPNEARAGLVNILGSSPGDPFDSATERSQNDFLDECGAFDGNEFQEFWGTALAWGEFDGDTPSLVVGGQGESLGGADRAGRITVMFGSAAGCFDQNTSGILETAETNDGFGNALATGDFDDDGFDDLAIGAPGEEYDDIPAARGGGVNVIFGSAGGLTVTGDLHLSQIAFPPEVEFGEDGERFGDALASGDFDGDGHADLAIGAPHEVVDDVAEAGSIHVAYGDPSGFDESAHQTFHSNLPAGMPDSPNTADHFGGALAAGDFDGSGTDDLVIGMPGEDLASANAAGAVTVLYGLDRETGAFGEVHLSSSNSFPELAGNRVVFVTRTGGAVLAAAVDHARTSGTATPGADFNYNGGTENWTAGETGFELFTVQILADTLDEGDETIQIALSDPSAGLAIGTPSTVTLTIEDDDEGGVVSLLQPVFVGTETAGQVVVVVQRTGGEASGVTVSYRTTNVTAIAGVDYVAAIGNLTFGAGETTKTIPVTLIDDGVPESAEVFTITLESPGGGATLGLFTVAQIVILGDTIFVDGFETGDTDRWSDVVP